MQTGNTVFLALGASHQPPLPPFAWLKSGTAIFFFLVGCFVIPRLMRLLKNGPVTRAALAASFALQSICAIIAAALVTASIVPQSEGLESPADRNPHNPFFVELIPIALLAFQAGGQVVASRMLGYGEIPTTVLTSAYCDLTSDEKLFAIKNGKRDRRAISAITLLAGAIMGGWITRSSARMETVLWIVAACKAGLALAWSFWKAKEVRPSV